MRNEGKKRTLELSLIQGFSKSESFLVVPPGIVINTQAALYLHFKESQNPQSPPIAPPQNCAVRQRLAESSSYFDAKVMKIFETEMTTLKFCSTSVRNP